MGSEGHKDRRDGVRNRGDDGANMDRTTNQNKTS